ncbi:MAG: hypothetical protein H0U49_10890, partial [Parachlamydiaceae bacterium]|nr:hypothetical protein [Parachlamydiaceae bacterium]
RLLAIATVFSYLTVILPFGIFCVGKAASLVGRIWPKTQLSDLDIRVANAVVPPIDTKTEIVIVGGGPVGLWTAIQMRVRTNKKITIVEKYNEYQRADIRLSISARSLGGIPEDPGLMALVKEWGNKTVPIKTMEEALAKRANELGIKVLSGQAANPKLLPSQFPAAKLFVGADGARSITRQHISGEDYKFNTILQNLVQVHYIIDPNLDERDDCVEIMKVYSDSYRTQKFAGHLITEAISRQADGKLKVTLQIFVDKSIYDQMQNASFKNPYYFETHLNIIPEALREILIKWWGAREGHSDQYILQSFAQKNKITVIALGSYAAKNIVKCDEQGKMWALVGDAAAAFPFFRAINNGFLLGTELARRTAQAFKSEKTSLNGRLNASFFNKYSSYATWRVYIERILASVKDFFITCSKIGVQISAVVPWQINKFSERDKHNFYERGVAIWTRLSGSPPPPRTPERKLLSTLKKVSA